MIFVLTSTLYPSARFASLLENDPEALDQHSLVHSLAHIVDRESGRRGCSQSLHLHSGLAFTGDRGLDVDAPRPSRRP